jgi:hypothetical protein
VHLEEEEEEEETLDQLRNDQVVSCRVSCVVSCVVGTYLESSDGDLGGLAVKVEAVVQPEDVDAVHDRLEQEQALPVRPGHDEADVIPLAALHDLDRLPHELGVGEQDHVARLRPQRDGSRGLTVVGQQPVL